MADKQKNVKIKLSADTKEAIRSVQEFERQVNKLGDLADQGSRRQDGFLSSKQVQMYKNILKEMENSYEQHQRTMQTIQQKYQQSKKSPAHQKMASLQQEVQKRQQNLTYAEGGNKWGNVATPLIQEFHRTKLESAQEDLKTYRSSDEWKNAKQNTSQLQAELSAMRSAMSQLQSERNRGSVHSDRIGNMHEQDPYKRRMIHGTAHAIAHTGAITSIGAYLNYTHNGIDILRNQEAQTNQVVLQSRSFEQGQPSGDRQYRRDIYKVGTPQNYSISQTAQTQGVLISGGTDGNMNHLNEDTRAVQRFSRSYALDVNQTASSGALLQRIGTFSEGEQQRFAEMIAGAISKGGMSGREAEMMQSIVSLAQNVSSNQASYSQGQFRNVANLQVAMGNAVPGLKGEKGAQLLSNMDSAIKNSDQGLDLMMGKGTQYTGIQGMYQLKLQQEQGLSNPKNLQSILQGAKRMFGTGKTGHDMTGFALQQELGLPLNEYEALSKSGLLDKLRDDPNSVTSKDLSKAGAKDLAKQWKQYTTSETSKVDSNNANSENTQASNAVAADNTSKALKGAFYSMPLPMQIGTMMASGAGGYMLMRQGGKLLTRGVNAVSRKLFPSINGEGGWRNALGKFFNKGGGNPPTPPVPPVSEQTSPILDQYGNPIIRESSNPIPPAGGASEGILTRLKNFGSGAVSKVVPKLKNFGTGALDVLGKVGGKAPIIGAGIGAVADKATTHDSWGRAITKGIGGAIGGTIGGALAVGSGFFSGGLGWLGTGAAAMGGGYVGEKAANGIYSLFAGNSDTQPKKVPTANPVANPVKDPTASNSSTVSNGATDATNSANNLQVNNVAVSKFNVNDKEFASYFTSTKKNAGTNGKKPEQVIRIVVEGKIDGMNADNQDQVSSSIKNYFSDLLSPYHNPLSYNLAFDQIRT